MCTESRLTECMAKLYAMATTRTYALMKSTRGQGTTEYAILVGVLVVIAILAIVVFRPKVQELWDAIADGMSKL